MRSANLVDLGNIKDDVTLSDVDQNKCDFKNNNDQWDGMTWGTPQNSLAGSSARSDDWSTERFTTWTIACSGVWYSVDRNMNVNVKVESDAEQKVRFSIPV